MSKTEIVDLSKFTKEESEVLLTICYKVTIDGAHAKILGRIIDKLQYKLEEK